MSRLESCGAGVDECGTGACAGASHDRDNDCDCCCDYHSMIVILCVIKMVMVVVRASALVVVVCVVDDLCLRRMRGMKRELSLTLQTACYRVIWFSSARLILA